MAFTSEAWNYPRNMRLLPWNPPLVWLHKTEVVLGADGEVTASTDLWLMREPQTSHPGFFRDLDSSDGMVNVGRPLR